MQYALLCSFLRYSQIVCAGTHRHPCFLAHGRWKAIIKPLEAEPYDEFDTVLNIAVGIPGFLYDLDALKAGALSDKVGPDALALRTKAMLMALQGWREASIPLVSAADDSQTYSLRTAAGIAFHHMLLLLIEELCCLLQILWLRPPSLSSRATMGLISASATGGREERRHVLGSEILRLAKLSISYDTAIYGVLPFIMSLHVAHDNLIRGSLEMGAIKHFMKTLL